jgi:hypothetical protein
MARAQRSENFIMLDSCHTIDTTNDMNGHQTMKFSTSKNTMAKCQYRFNHESFLIASIWLSFLCGSISAQDCACSPGSYKFTFDFSLTCPPVNITRNGGVETSYCQISEYGGPGDNITDLVPVSFFIRQREISYIRCSNFQWTAYIFSGGSIPA